ncbi:MAG: molybdenum cofactor biosynthesis protein MoaE [Pseudomonadota bacterium]
MPVTIQTTPIDEATALATLHALTGRAGGKDDAHETGAVVQFSGRLRGRDGKGQAVRFMEIECYQSMAYAHLQRIVDRVQATWSLRQVAVIHRIGRLKPGEVIVWVGAGSAHRADAFAAAMAIMDYLKTEVPMWKKEVTDNGARWIDPPSPHDDRSMASPSG